MQESVPVGAGEARPPDPKTVTPSPGGDGPLADPRALQILSAEHSSLLASRSLAYNEAFSRAGMFLSFLSATLIVIGFLIGTQGLSADVIPVATILLTADLFIGLATTGRLIDVSGEELHCVRGMNRIRHAYRELVPGIEPYFVSGFHDDARGVLATYGDVTSSGSVLANMVHGITTTVGMVATIVAMIFGAICGLVALGLGAGVTVTVASAVVAFLVGFGIFVIVGMRTALGQQARAESRFPTPPDGPA
jgi:hypothetical protein